MFEASVGSNTELPTNEKFIRYKGKIVTSYEQMLPPIAEMVKDGEIWAIIKPNAEDPNATVTFRTSDGSTIDGESTFICQGNDLCLFKVGMAKYSVIQFPYMQALDVDDTVLDQLRADIDAIGKQYNNMVSNITLNADGVLTNKTNIASNLDKIVSNQTGINETKTLVNDNKSSIANNEIAIRANADNISSDLTLINTNKTNIATNASSITGHSESINGLQEHVSTLLVGEGGYWHADYSKDFYLEGGQETIVYHPDNITDPQLADNMPILFYDQETWVYSNGLVNLLARVFGLSIVQ